MTVEADRVDPILQIQESLRGIVSRNSEMQVPSFTVNDEGDLPHGIETVATASGAGFWNHYIVGGQLTHTRLALEELQPTNVPRFQRNAIRLIREWQNSDNRNETDIVLSEAFSEAATSFTWADNPDLFSVLLNAAWDIATYYNRLEGKNIL